MYVIPVFFLFFSDLKLLFYGLLDHDKLLIVSLIIFFIYIFSLCNYRLIIVIEKNFNAFPLVA